MVEAIEQVFESLLKRYEIALEISLRDFDLIFDCVH